MPPYPDPGDPEERTNNLKVHIKRILCYPNKDKKIVPVSVHLASPSAAASGAFRLHLPLQATFSAFAYISAASSLQE
jgi:hypothetical protein